MKCFLENYQFCQKPGNDTFISGRWVMLFAWLWRIAYENWYVTHPLPKVIFDSYFYPLSANPTKWFKHTQTICWLLPNCLSVFDHFVMLALKGLTETMTSTLIIGNWAKKLLELSDPEKSLYKGGNTIEVLINLLFTWKINTIRI